MNSTANFDQMYGKRIFLKQTSEALDCQKTTGAFSVHKQRGLNHKQIY